MEELQKELRESLQRSADIAEAAADFISEHSGGAEMSQDSIKQQFRVLAEGHASAATSMLALCSVMDALRVHVENRIGKIAKPN